MKKLSIAIIMLGLTAILAGCNAVGQGKKCDYTNENGEKSIVYIKNGIMYNEANQSDINIKSISKNNKIYIRSDKESQGIMIDLAQNTGIKIDTKEIKSTQNMIDAIQEKSTCSTESIADSFFVIPSDKTFNGKI